MKYEYKCHSCETSFLKDLPINDRELPLKEPCPACAAMDVKRVFSSSITYDTVDVHTRAKRVGGEAYTETMKRIRNYYPNSSIPDI